MMNKDEKKLDALLMELKNDIPKAPLDEKQQILARIVGARNHWTLKSFSKVFATIAAAAVLVLAIYSQKSERPVSDEELEAYLSDSYAVVYEENEPLDYVSAEFVITGIE